jgi:hypothetical protein
MNTAELNVARIAAGVASIAAAAAVPPDLDPRIAAALGNGVTSGGRRALGGRGRRGGGRHPPDWND